MEGPVYVVFNPRSGKGRGAALVEPLLRALRDGRAEVAHGLSQAPGDEARVATEAVAAGYRTIVAVGGDGTWGNVGGALIRSGQPVRLALVAGGTGCDLAKSLGIPARDVAAAADVVLRGVERTIDAGRIEDRYFLNVSGFGFDMAVLEDSWTVKWLGGDLLYLYCALRQLYRFPGFELETSVDDEPPVRERLMMLIVSNARVFGGAFRIAPEALLDDGRLDGVFFRDMPVSRRLAVMGRLLRGTHAGAREVALRRGQRFRLRFAEPPTYETDGEWNRARSAELTVESVPAALRVLVPA